jgi:WD40 repeat protein
VAQVQRHRRTIAAALLGLAALADVAAMAQDQVAKDATDLYDRPVLAIDPGRHTNSIRAQGVDAGGGFAVTGGADRTVRIWSVADGNSCARSGSQSGPNKSVRFSRSPSARTDQRLPPADSPRRATADIQFIYSTATPETLSPEFATICPPDGRYLAVTLAKTGLRVFDRKKDWSEAFRDDQYAELSIGAAFASDGRLATTAFDGFIRLYKYEFDKDKPNFQRVGQPVKTASGQRPYGLAFNPDGKLLAVGYVDVAAVDILDGTTLSRVGEHAPANAAPDPVGFDLVAWSNDGQTLFAAGGVTDAQRRLLLFAWDRGGLGHERRMSYCAHDTAIGLDALPEGRVLVSSMRPCFGLSRAHGEPIWTAASPILDFRDQSEVMRVSQDGQAVDFGDTGSFGSMIRFDLRSLTLSSPPPMDGLTFAASREGLKIDGWRNGPRPTLNGRALPLATYDMARSVAIAPDAKHFLLGSSNGLAAFDDAGTRNWWWPSRSEVWAVNASRDGRVIVTADGDGAIRWHRADDGRELLALQVLPNRKEASKWDWVLWTPEGFYETTPGAQDALKWVTNHGSDSAATTLPVSAIPRLHRPDALPLVLQELETARALGIAELAASRLAVQKATGSAKPPGGTLHVLAIGVDKFGDKAGDMRLDYAAEDAHDVASALRDSQKLGPGNASLYADVKIQYLPNDQADNTAIRDALDDMAVSMRTSSPDQDVAVILVSSHGEMIDGEFYLVPYGVDLGSKNKIFASTLSATDFAKKVQAIASHGKVLLLLDACHSGAVRPGGWATDPNAKILRDVLNMDNVTVLTSSDEKGLSEELPAWQHGALAQAFLDALTGAGDSNGVIRLTALINQMDGDLRTLTQGRQSLGQHANFGGDLFMASHY